MSGRGRIRGGAGLARCDVAAGLHSARTVSVQIRIVVLRYRLILAAAMTVIHAAVHTIVMMRRGIVRWLIMVRESERIIDASQMYSSSLWQRRAVEMRSVYL